MILPNVCLGAGTEPYVLNWSFNLSGVDKPLTDQLLNWRSEFPILDRTVYLISHSLGAMPKKTYQRLNDYAETWATRGVRAWAEGWWEMPVSVGDEVGRIIGADPGSVAMHQNVSIRRSFVLSCF